MIPPIFTYASASIAVKALIGTSPVRFWPFASAPQPGQPLYALPYAVWQLVYGQPENYLGDLPDTDQAGIQVDAYAPTVTAARAVLMALRDAFEPFGYVVAYNGEEKDQPTGLYRASLTVEFWTDR
jgi:hypothetical protein